MPDPTFIETDAQLHRACASWLKLDAIGLDTEFERTRTYYSRPALIQVFDGEHVSLLDPLAIDNFAPLGELLLCADVTKVMHASEGDNEIFEQLCGIEPHPVFDTQLAAAFAGHGFSLGYRALAKRLVGADVAKDETRSDWLRRPLSQAQIAYAALDVVHLLPMHRELHREVSELGREQWLREEIRRMLERRALERDPRRAYLRIRQTRRLLPSQLATLRELAAWRELEARERDLPRQKIVKDRSLVAIAENEPVRTEELGDIPELSANAVTRYAQPLLGAVARARAAHAGAGAEAPPAPIPTVDRRLNPWLKSLKQVLNQKADALNMPAPLLAQSRTLESLLVAFATGERDIPEELRGWREAVITDALIAELGDLHAG